MVVNHLNIRDCVWDGVFLRLIFCLLDKIIFIILLASQAACGLPEHLES